MVNDYNDEDDNYLFPTRNALLLYPVSCLTLHSTCWRTRGSDLIFYDDGDDKKILWHPPPIMNSRGNSAPRKYETCVPRQAWLSVPLHLPCNRLLSSSSSSSSIIFIFIVYMNMKHHDAKHLRKNLRESPQDKCGWRSFRCQVLETVAQESGEDDILTKIVMILVTVMVIISKSSSIFSSLF